MKITCFGARGSICSPGPATTKFGGNTSCFYLEAGPFRVILDCGSGARVLGDAIMSDLLLPQMKAEGRMGKSFIVLLSHYHPDHRDGIGFCVPMFIGGNTFHFHGQTPPGAESATGPKTVVEQMLSAQQIPPFFPVALESLPAKKGYHAHALQFSETIWYEYWTNTGAYHFHTMHLEEPQPERLLKIATIPLNHPNGCLGYRIEYLGKVAVYATDNEPLRHPNAQLTKAAKGADWLYMDGQYTEEQLSGPTQTFGHGTPLACLEQATACGAKSLIIGHHDPKRTDMEVAALHADLMKHISGVSYSGTVEFAEECRTWEI